MRDERRPGLDGPGRMVKSRGLDGKISYLTKIWGFAKGLYQIQIKVALRFSGVNFVSLNFIDYVSMALCMGDNRVGDTSDLLDLPQEMGLARRGSF